MRRVRENRVNFGTHLGVYKVLREFAAKYLLVLCPGLTIEKGVFTSRPHASKNTHQAKGQDAVNDGIV